MVEQIENTIRIENNQIQFPSNCSVNFHFLCDDKNNSEKYSSYFKDISSNNCTFQQFNSIEDLKNKIKNREKFFLIFIPEKFRENTNEIHKHLLASKHLIKYMIIDETQLKKKYFLKKIKRIKYIILIKIGKTILCENYENQNYFEIAITIKRRDNFFYYYTISTFKLNSPLYYSQIIQAKENNEKSLEIFILKIINDYLKKNIQSFEKIYIHFNGIDYKLIYDSLNKRSYWFDDKFPNLQKVPIILINYQGNGGIKNMKENDVCYEDHMEKDGFYFGSFYTVNEISISFKSNYKNIDKYLISSSKKTTDLYEINYPFPFFNVLKFRHFMEKIGVYENKTIFSFFPFYLMDD